MNPLARTLDPGQVVVVTGASSGIGEAVAHQLAAGHHHLVLVARREEELEKVAARCAELGSASALVVPTDVSDDDAVAELVSRALQEHDRIDAVVHCAGVVSYGRLEDTDAADFEQVVRINLLGAASVARHVVPVLRRQERGDLVLVGSLLGHVAIPEMTPYVVSKWGVRALARQLKIENSDLPHVHVTHVAPGSVDTPIYDSALDEAGGVNTPPPPTISPERAARAIVGAIGSRRGETQTAWANYGLVAAFNLAPAAYDRLIGPVFRAVSRRPQDR